MKLVNSVYCFVLLKLLCVLLTVTADIFLCFADINSHFFATAHTHTPAHSCQLFVFKFQTHLPGIHNQLVRVRSRLQLPPPPIRCCKDRLLYLTFASQWVSVLRCVVVVAADSLPVKEEEEEGVKGKRWLLQTSTEESSLWRSFSSFSAGAECVSLKCTMSALSLHFISFSLHIGVRK